MSVFVAFRKEWLEMIRSYRLLVVAVVLVFFGLTSPFLTKFTPELLAALPTGGMTIEMPPPTVGMAIGQYVKNMAQFGLILGILLTMGSVSQEKDKGTAAMILVKPISRGAFLGAKFLGLAIMIAISLVLAGIACYYYTMLLFEAMDLLRWLVLNALILLYTLVFIAITLLCSTVSKSQPAAGGIALGLIVVPGTIGSILGLGKYLPGELITWGTRLMQGDTTTSWIAFGISIGLIVIPLLAAWLIFKRQEL
jgi:ABC-2 type transport system permease protein